MRRLATFTASVGAAREGARARHTPYGPCARRLLRRDSRVRAWRRQLAPSASSSSEATSGKLSDSGSGSLSNSDAGAGALLPLAARPPPPNTSTWFHRPVDLHVHIARLPLPREESRDHAALQRWLHERYVLKDRHLHQFEYSTVHWLGREREREFNCLFQLQNFFR